MEILEIKKILKERKITYAELSKMSGISESAINKIFGGFAKYPRIDTMKAIEQALGIENEKSRSWKDRLLNWLRILLKSLGTYFLIKLFMPMLNCIVLWTKSKKYLLLV